MASIFSKIIAGEIPSYKVAEDEHFYAFLDISPMAKGHTLVVPKTEVDYIFDLPDNTLAAMHVFAKRVAEGIKKSNSVPACRCNGNWDGSAARTHSPDSHSKGRGYVAKQSSSATNG